MEYPNLAGLDARPANQRLIQIPWEGTKLLSRSAISAMLLTTAMVVPAAAQDNLQTLQNMQKTGASFSFIDQSGPAAESLRNIVEHVNVPEGFEVSLYAVVPDARSMAVAPQGTVTFVGTRKDKVWSVVDRDRNRVADQVMDFAPSITFDIPNGPCFSRDGFLYIAERNRVLQFPAAEFFFEGPDRRWASSLPRAS
jgi:hypothetical protein